jgi:hypothetical protein
MGGYEGTTVRLLPPCPLCHGETEAGFLPEFATYRSSAGEWIEGAPERRWLLEELKIAGKRRYSVVTYRCTQCGYLISFANTLVE